MAREHNINGVVVVVVLFCFFVEIYNKDEKAVFFVEKRREGEKIKVG